MRKLIGVLVLALLGFYVGWPAYNGYRIKSALDAGDPGVLAAKIDFDGVRETLRPAVTAELERSVAKSLQAGGGDNAALLDQLKSKVMPKLVETALAAVVTPETVLRIYRDGGDVKGSLSRIIAEKTGGSGGIGGMIGAATGGGGKGGLGDLVGAAAGALGIDPGTALGGAPGGSDPQPAPAQAAAPAAAPSYGLANIKKFGFNGPLGYSVGLAKDPAASAPDVTVDLAFRGGDWKIVGLTPKI